MRAAGVVNGVHHPRLALSLPLAPDWTEDTRHAPMETSDIRLFKIRDRRRQQGFSLIEQIVTVALVAVIVPALLVLLTGLVRQASTSGAAVDMLTLARSQLESIKAEPYLNRPKSYSKVSPIPEKYIIDIGVEPVQTYTYPPPKSDIKLSDEVQLITVEVRCPGCSPPIGSMILKDYKVRR